MIEMITVIRKACPTSRMLSIVRALRRAMALIPRVADRV
ncbi:MAG: hypothetical protein BWZ01_02985 [Deltaproteobacteria bacterium ADurb.BinA179]|nr:MAG: hypothetical protein BWZ01_02985 [Deltaproteobacteria bacterium ADurb.BinA179]